MKIRVNHVFEYNFVEGYCRKFVFFCSCTHVEEVYPVGLLEVGVKKTSEGSFNIPVITRAHRDRKAANSGMARHVSLFIFALAFTKLNSVQNF